MRTSVRRAVQRSFLRARSCILGHACQGQYSGAHTFQDFLHAFRDTYFRTCISGHAFQDVHFRTCISGHASQDMHFQNSVRHSTCIYTHYACECSLQGTHFRTHSSWNLSHIAVHTFQHRSGSILWHCMHHHFCKLQFHIARHATAALPRCHLSTALPLLCQWW